MDGRTGGQGRLLWTPTGKPGVQNSRRPQQHQYRIPLDLLIPKSNQIIFGYMSSQTLAQIVWNTSPLSIKNNEPKIEVTGFHIEKDYPITELHHFKWKQLQTLLLKIV